MGPYPERLKDFGYLWRFTDARKYTQLSDEEFAHFHLLSEKESRQKWLEMVYAGPRPSHHLSLLIANKRIKLPDNPTFWFDDDDIEGDRTAHILRENIPAPETKECFFFWNASIAVKTQWGLFLNHWDDFIYPSDDSNILLFTDMKNTVIFIDEQWYLLDRKIGKPLFPL